MLMLTGVSASDFRRKAFAPSLLSPSFVGANYVGFSVLGSVGKAVMLDAFRTRGGQGQRGYVGYHFRAGSRVVA